jgi:hypothetical protein
VSLEPATCGACLHTGHSNVSQVCTFEFRDGTRCGCPQYVQNDCPGSLGQAGNQECPGNNSLLKKHGPECSEYPVDP